MKRKATFYASPEFVQVRRRWFGLRYAVPHPTLIKLAPGVYFGHPETVERVKADVLKLKEMTDGGETET
jgi:hypothetical protein